MVVHHGTLIVVNQNRSDGARFPVSVKRFIIGRDSESDIRVQRQDVSRKHCMIDVKKTGQVVLVNFSKANPTFLNGVPVLQTAVVGHCDKFSVGNQSFRWEFPEGSKFNVASRQKIRKANGKMETEVNKTPSSLLTVLRSQSDSKLKSVTKPKRVSLKNSFYSSDSSNTQSSRKKVTFSSSNSDFSSNQTSIDERVGDSFTRRKSSRFSKRDRSLSYASPFLSTRRRRTDIGSLRATTSRVLCRPSFNVKTAVQGDGHIIRKAKSLPCKVKLGIDKKFAAHLKKRVLKSDVENAVKIDAPASPDSKKLAALRTIHASKLKLKRQSQSSSSAVEFGDDDLPTCQTPYETTTFSLQGRLSFKSSRRSSPLRISDKSACSTAYNTPNISKDVFVSPLGISSVSNINFIINGENMETSISGFEEHDSGEHEVEVKQRMTPRRSSVGKDKRLGKKQGSLTQMSPVSKYSNINKGKRLLRSPRKSSQIDYTNASSIKRLKSPVKSPRADYSDVCGVKRLLRSPTKSPQADYSDVLGVKRLLRSSTKSQADYSDVRGVKRLLRSPTKSPQADYSDVRGIKRLLRSAQRSPQADYTNVRGVKRLLRSAKKSPINKLGKQKKSSMGFDGLNSPSSKSLGEVVCTPVLRSASFIDSTSIRGQHYSPAIHKGTPDLLFLDGSSRRTESPLTPKCAPNIYQYATPTGVASSTPIRSTRSLKTSVASTKVSPPSSARVLRSAKKEHALINLDVTPTTTVRSNGSVKEETPLKSQRRPKQTLADVDSIIQSTPNRVTRSAARVLLQQQQISLTSPNLQSGKKSVETPSKDRQVRSGRKTRGSTASNKSLTSTSPSSVTSQRPDSVRKTCLRSNSKKHAKQDTLSKSTPKNISLREADVLSAEVLSKPTRVTRKRAPKEVTENVDFSKQTPERQTRSATTRSLRSRSKILD